MHPLSVSEARRPEAVGKKARLQGWVRTRRDSKGGFSFIELNDGSCLGNLQIIADGKLPNYESEIKKLGVGSSITVIGEVKASPARGQATELHAESVTVHGFADPEKYPLQKKGHSMEFLREIAHLRPRTNTIGAVARVRNSVCRSIHDFFQERGFLYVHTPIITGSDCEGAGAMFRVTTLDLANPPLQSPGAASLRRQPGKGEPPASAGGARRPSPPAPLHREERGEACTPSPASGEGQGGGQTPLAPPGRGAGGEGPGMAIDFSQDFFARPTFLTVSGQLEGETYACALGKIYTFGPTFRAENSNTSRHLAEFWMVEPEMAFYELSDNMDLAEAFIKRIIRDLLDRCEEDLKFFNERIDKGLIARLEHTADSQFLRLSYTEAVQHLESSGEKFEFPVRWGIDLQSEHERYLTEKKFQKPVILFDYPKTIKAFYMRLNDDGRTVRAMDVLVPGVGEIIGGSQREERLEVLEARLREMGLDPEDYWWYLDLRRYGTVPHSGFGLGVERTMLFVTGLGNIRDVIPYPRYPGSAEF